MKLNHSKKSKVIFIITISIIALVLISIAAYSIAYANKIYPNQFIGSIDLGGKTKGAALEIINEASKSYLNKEISLKLEADARSDRYSIKPTEIGAQYKTDQTIDKLWDYGRSRNPIVSFFQQWKALFSKNQQRYELTINEESLDKKIAEISDSFDRPGRDYSIEYSDENFQLTEDKAAGEIINRQKLALEVKDKLSFLDSNELKFTADKSLPQVTKENAAKRLAEAKGILSVGELTLAVGTESFKIDKDTIGSFIYYLPKENDLELNFNRDRIKVYVDLLAKNIDVESKDAKLAAKEGKVYISEPEVIGRKLDKDQTAVDIENALSARVKENSSVSDPLKIELKVAIDTPELASTSINALGLIDLVGTGSTDFKKSPQNRVHNIQVGANAINGTLLKPGETFSTLKRLGAIDAASGYLEELVIKENRTVPEFGGGLCQVSSTLFRAALNAGLKIEERQNHKYRVSYYEPPVGMDATIYDPAPDFRFTNNYGSSLFIQSRVEGTKITFEIYGTKDGRTITVSEPEIYDIVEPGPAQIVETDTLPPGERKLVEKPHQGASAKFNYKVILLDKTLQEKTFTSKYVPWPEKWLVGKGTVEQLPEQQPPA